MNNFNPKFMLHGADYNYEQWLDYPDILDRDFELMKLAHCNVMSVGIFSWAMLGPEYEYAFYAGSPALSCHQFGKPKVTQEDVARHAGSLTSLTGQTHHPRLQRRLALNHATDKPLF